MTQTFLETGQNPCIVAGLDIDDAVGRQSRLGQGRGKQVGSRHAPQHLPWRPGGYPGGEQGRRGAVDRALTAACHFVQRPQGKPPLGQMVVYFGHTERQNAMAVPIAAFEATDSRTQFVKGGMRQDGHDTGEGFHILKKYMFSFCSQISSESR